MTEQSVLPHIEYENQLHQKNISAPPELHLHTVSLECLKKRESIEARFCSLLKIAEEVYQ